MHLNCPYCSQQDCMHPKALASWFNSKPKCILFEKQSDPRVRVSCIFQHQLKKPAPPEQFEPDWSYSETDVSSLWKNPTYSLADRLRIADGTIAYERKVNENLRKRIEEMSTSQEGDSK